MADDKAAKTPAFKNGDAVKLTDKEHPLHEELNTAPLAGDCTVEYSREVDGELVYSCISPDGKHSFNATEGQLTAIPKVTPATGPSRAGQMNKPAKAKEPPKPANPGFPKK